MSLFTGLCWSCWEPSPPARPWFPCCCLCPETPARTRRRRTRSTRRDKLLLACCWPKWRPAWTRTLIASGKTKDHQDIRCFFSCPANPDLIHERWCANPCFLFWTLALFYRGSLEFPFDIKMLLRGNEEFVEIPRRSCIWRCSGTASQMSCLL